MNRLTTLTILVLCLLLGHPLFAHAQLEGGPDGDSSSSKVDSILQDAPSSDSNNSTDSSDTSNSSLTNSSDNNSDANSDTNKDASSDTQTSRPSKNIRTQKKGTGFTGTLSDEDPDSDAFKEKKVFGDDEAGDSDTDSQNPNATHLLKVSFESQVVISDTKTSSSYLEINYTTKIEQEIEVKNKRFRTKGKADIVTDVIGNLAGNELFSCKLDIQFDKTPIDIMTRYNQTEETEDTPLKSELAVQLKFNKSDFMENWFSNCMGVDGSVLNTQGDKEKYLAMTLEAITPSLDSLLFQDYVPEETSTLDITTDPIVVDDIDSLQQYSLQGSGTVTIEPLTPPTPPTATTP